MPTIFLHEIPHVSLIDKLVMKFYHGGLFEGGAIQSLGRAAVYLLIYLFINFFFKQIL